MILLWPFRPPPFLRMTSALVSPLTAFILSLFIAPNHLFALNHSSVVTLFVTSSLTPSSQAPYAFPLSESELLSLAKALAPRVDLFREVWEIDPEAEFFAGTTRDYLYWILGHFKGLENLESSAADPNVLNKRREKIAKIKAQLLAIPFIKFNEIVGPESDADIMTKNREALRSLRAEDFAIRKLDFISFDRALPGQKMYQDEINQGYIPSEKIRLSKKGIVTDSNFGNGVSDLISGNLSIQFPDREKFWNTHYAKEGANHPLLLALRYVRILAQDYLQRHGSEIPDSQKLEVPMTDEIKNKIQNLIRDAMTDLDGSFKEFLQNHQGKKWLNASIQKSFRSFTNANAAFELMKELGLLGLIEVYPDEIESVHQYLLKTKRNETQIAENFKKFRISPEDLYENIESYLPDRELYHGTASELAFRNIIYQGVIPSDSGSAGRGLYGVSKKDLKFAKEWSKRKSQQDDLVIALKLKSKTRIVDITKGNGKKLFDRWEKSIGEDMRKNPTHTQSISQLTASVNSQNQDLYDAFTQDFGIDILRYPYNNSTGKVIEAFVLKNADKIEKRRGVFKNPRPLSELLKDAEKAKKNIDLSLLKDFLETPLTKDEQNKVFSILGEDYFKIALESHNIKTLRNLLNVQIVTLFELLLQSPLTATHALVWMEVPALLKDTNWKIREHIASVLETQSTWPNSFWMEVPAFLKNICNDHVAFALQKRRSWPISFWTEVPSLMKDPERSVQFWMNWAFQNQKTWPISFWDEVPALLNDPDQNVRWHIASALQNQSSWTQDIITLVAQSIHPEFSVLKTLKPSILDLSSCKNSLSEIKDSQPQNNSHGEVKP